MRKFLSSPVNMALSDADNLIYQTALKHIAPISLNLMAVKVEEQAPDFLTWCQQLSDICQHKLNMDLLDAEQFAPLKKLQDVLTNAISIGQLKTLRIAPWPIFAAYLQQNAELQSLDERLALLTHIEQIKAQPLAEMIEEDRLAFAGKHLAKHDPAVYKYDVEWFASTKAAKSFQRLLASHPAAFDAALASIPLEGEVSWPDYQAFVEQYQAIFTEHAEGEAAPLAPATRLLAMRRPDYFIALTNAKIDAYCQAFGLSKFNNRDFVGYWHELVQATLALPLWRQAEPEDEQEQLLWRNRAILIDLFFYADENSKLNSNYRRLLEKPAKSIAAVKIPRSKMSVETLVDRALEAEDIPEYLLAKRDSIINQVTNSGKSVEQVIGLMRTIFG